MEFSIFISSLFIFVLVLIVFFHVQNKSTAKIGISNKPPGPPKLPLIGNLHQLLDSLPHRRLENLAKTYGPLMHLQLGQVSAIVISSPEVAKQCLKEFDINFSDRGRAAVTDIVLYNRIDIAFAPYGEYWRQVRKIAVLQLFSAKRVEMFRSVREEEVSNCIAFIRSKVGTPINVSDLVFSLVNSVVTRTVIGRKNKNQKEIIQLVHRFLKAVGGFGIVDMFPSLEFIHIITRMKSRLLKFRKDTDALFENIINEHKAELKGRQGEASNLLDVLLELEGDPESPVKVDGIKAILLDMFSGGTDTSATVLEWAMSELMKNPRTMRKAQEEVRKVYVEHGKLDETVLHELNFLNAIIKEIMSLHPPVPIIEKLCKEECKINGYDINVKTEVLISAWAIGRDPKYWIEPEKFYPERFLGSEIDYKGLHFEYIPFGAGRRKCPGLLMGIANVELSLVNLLCHFDWELPDEMKPQDLEMKESFAVVFFLKNPWRDSVSLQRLKDWNG